MNITFINGTNRQNNKSLNLTQKLSELEILAMHTIEIVDLANFTQLFSGDYINRENASQLQRIDLEAIAGADLLVFVVPVYHGSIPAPLKNFIDIVKDPEIYNNKTIAFISNNSGSIQGAYQAEDAVKSIIAYDRLHSNIVSKIERMTLGDFDYERAEEFLLYCLKLSFNNV